MPHTLATYNIDRYDAGDNIRRYQFQKIREETPTGTEDVERLVKVLTLDRKTKHVLKSHKVTGTIFVPDHVWKELRQRKEGKI